MPNRVIRDKILDSDKINALSFPGEVFYRRLMSVVDDFGRFDGRHQVIRSRAYPLRLDSVSEKDIEKWIRECVESGLVEYYWVDGKAYIEMLRFDHAPSFRKRKCDYPNKDGKYETKADYLARMESDNGSGDINSKQLSNPKQADDDHKPKNSYPRNRQELVDQYFLDLPNSEEFNRVASNIGVDKDILKKAIPTFKIKAELEYANFIKFVQHFKNWYVQNNTSAVAATSKTLPGSFFKDKP